MSRNPINDKNKKTTSKIDTSFNGVSPFADLRREQHLRRLEPRIMFDGAAVATIDVAADGADAGQDASAPVLTPTSENGSNPTNQDTPGENQTDDESATGADSADQPRIIIFIDAAVADPAEIIASADPSAEIYILDPAIDGLAQIASVLQGQSDIDAVHIISHGNSGQLILGNQSYDASDLADHASDLAIIGNALSADGDILLYGCNIADNENGIEYLDALAALTGADIAASDDDTGHADLGGDWELEASTGDIEAIALSPTSWAHLLDLAITDASVTGANGLAQQILGDGVTINSATYFGGGDQAGTFVTGGGSSFGSNVLAFDDGVIFSTGTAASVAGPNNSGNYTVNAPGGIDGDADFNALAGGSTFDASYVVIDFTPDVPPGASIGDTGRMTMQIVFGSDEYNEFVYGNVNDTLAVIVNGVNQATVPNGLAIGIDTINDAANFNPGSGNPAFDPNPEHTGAGFESANPTLYINNAGFNTQMDGFTITLPVTFDVIVGQSNTIKIGIADTGDAGWDSWLFVKADSGETVIVAENDNVSTPTNIPLTIDVTANDYDLQGDPLTVTHISDQPVSPGDVITLASGATVTVGTGGNLTVSGDGTNTANDAFTYQITDGNGGSSIAFVNVNITAPVVNSDPVADDESFAINEDSGPVSLDLLTGDTDPDGDTLSVQSINGTTVTTGTPQAIAIPNGTVNVDAAGNVTFTPAANYSGAINFDYVVSDGNGGTDTGSVSGSVNGAPTIDLDVTDAGVPGQNGYTFLTFSNPAISNDGQNEATHGVGNGETAVYSNVGTINGQAIDFIATVLNTTADASAPGGFDDPRFNVTGGDNANLNLGGNRVGTDSSATVEVRWQAVLSGTTTSVTGSFAMIVSDLDRGSNANSNKFEEISLDASSLDSYTLDGNTDITVTQNGSTINFNPTDADPGSPGVLPDNSVQLNFSNTSSFAITYNKVSFGGNFGLDGNFTVPFFNNPTNVDTNADFGNTFVEGDGAVAIADVDTEISDDGQIAGATITLTNAQADDLLNAPSGADLPAGITVDPASTATNIILTGTASTADYETAIKAITFENTSQTPNDTIVRTIDVQVTDDGGLTSNLATASINVIPVNDAPVAVDDGPIAIVGGTPLNLPVLTTDAGTGTVADSDVDGDTLTVTHITDPTNPGTPLAIFIGNPVTLASGTTIALLANGTLDVTTPLTSTGAETFDYTVSDGNGGTDTATVTLDRTSGNSDPVAQDDSVSVTEDTPVTGNVLDDNGNNADSDADGDTLSVTGFTIAGDLTNYAPGDTATIPNVGTLTIASNGAFTFTPALNYFGAVPVATYAISDGNGGSDSADLTLGPVTSVNDAPTADDESAITDEDTPVTINVLDGDTDIDGTIDPATVGIEDPANPGTYLTTVTEAGVGTWTVDSAPASPTFGQITFTPVAHYNGAVTPITYQVADNDGATTTALVNVTLNSVNDPPIIDLNDDNTTANLDHAVTFTEDGGAVNVTDVDADAIDPDDDKTRLVINVAGLQDGASEVLVIAGQSIPLNTTTLLQNIQIPGTTTNIIIAYSLTTGNIAITNASGSANPMPEADLDILLRGITYENTSQDPTSGDRTLTFTATDAAGASSAPAVSTITVAPVNDAPFANPETFTTNEDSSIINNVLANDTDVDSQSLTVTSATVDLDGNGTEDNFTIGGPAVQLDNAAGDPIGVFGLASDGSFVFQPAANYDGPVPQVTYTIDDGDGGTATTTLDITITPIADAPIADDESFDIDEDSGPVAIDLLDGDTDADGDILSVQSINGTNVTLGTPQAISVPNGTVNIDASGNVTFTPALNYFGPINFDYVVSDGTGLTDTGSVSGVVNSVNDQPANSIALGDQSTNDGEPVSIATFGGFTDADGDSLTFSLDPSAPSWLSIHPTSGVISGTPPANASQGGPTSNGQYSVIVIVTDPDGATAQDVFDLEVSNLDPVAVDDVASASEDGPNATGNVITDALTGDADTAPDSDPLTVTGAVQGANALTIGAAFTTAGGGVLTLNTDGSYDFDPGTAYNGLDDGETATEVVTYTVDDGNGGTDTATLTITINGANDAPVVVDPANPGTDPGNPIPANPATIIPTQNVDDGEAFTPASPLIDVSDYAIDPDAEPLTFTTVSPLPTGLTLNADGTVTGTIDKNASQGGDDPVNNPGVYTITVTIDDGDDTATVTLTIDVSNPAPVAVDDVAALGEDTANVTGNVITDALTGDADTAPDSDPLTVTGAVQGANALTIGAAFTTAGGGVLTLNTDGSYDFDPGTAYNGLDDGETATEVVTYTVDDGNGGTDTATLTITIDGANDAPVVVDPSVAQPDPSNPVPAGDPASVIPTQNVDDGEAFTPASPLIDVSDYAIDPDAEPLTFTTVSPLPTGLTLNADGTVTGTIDKNASQGGDDPVNNPGVYTITVTIDDGDDTATVTLTIDVSNPAPVAVDDVAALGEDTANVTGNVITDALTGDADTAPDSDPLTVTAATQGANALTIGAAFTTAGGGVLTLNTDGSYDFDPGTAYNGLDDGETATEVVTYTVDDGNGGTDTATLTITIDGANDAPVVVDPSVAQPDPSNPVPAGDPASVIPTQNVDDGEVFTPAAPLIDVSDYAIDPDAEPLTFTTVSPLPTGLTLNADGTVTGTIDKNASQGGDDPVNNPGVYTITVTIDDGDDTATVTLTIDVSNPAPVAVDDVASADEDVIQSGNVLTDPLTGDADAAPDSDPLTVTALSGGTVGTPLSLTYGELTLNADGSWIFTPNLAANALPQGVNVFEQVTYTVDDGNGGTDTATLSIELSGTNDTPIIIDPVNHGTPPIDPDNIVPVQTVEDAGTITPINVTPYFVDPDGESLVLSVDPADLPPGLSFNPATGVISGTPTSDASQGGPAGDGTYLVTVTATDPHGAVVTTIVTFDVSNPPPVAVDDSATVEQENPITIPVLDNDIDTDGDPLTVASATAANGTVTLNPDGTITYQPDPGYHGTDTIFYVISDGNGGYANASVSVTINAAGLNITQIEGIDPNPALITDNPLLLGDALTNRDPFEREIIHEFIRLIVEGRLHELEVQFGLGQDDTLVRAVQDLTREPVDNGSTVREMLEQWQFWRTLDALNIDQIFQNFTLLQDFKELDVLAADSNGPIQIPGDRILASHLESAPAKIFSLALKDEQNKFESEAQQLARDLKFG